MRLSFRQGLVSLQRNAFGQPQFLQASADNGFIDLLVNQTPCTISFCHGGSDYLQTFDKQVLKAWGPVVPNVDNHLYWDIDMLTANVTCGITTVIPVSQHTAPINPVVDQHWFDMTSTTMKVWNGESWKTKIRVFAAIVKNGNTATIQPKLEGSQVGLS
jgi:hypothetical protein